MWNVVFLPREKWTGYRLIMDYDTYDYYDVIQKRSDGGFSVEFVKKHSDEIIRRRSSDYDFPDSLYQPHWENAEAFGVFENGELIGAIEICPEEWCNRLIVTELWVAEGYRKKGVGKVLMDYAKDRAVKDSRRAIVLETQSSNFNAIGFYLHEGFTLIGFDSCCYSNRDVERKEVRLDLGWFPETDQNTNFRLKR